MKKSQRTHRARLPARNATSTLAQRFRDIRETTLALVAPLSAEDCALQSMPDASPVKWPLAHTSWFFETFVLAPNVAGYRPLQPHFEVLFNACYNAVGDKHPRGERGLISRPGHAEVIAYRQPIAVARDVGAR